MWLKQEKQRTQLVKALRRVVEAHLIINRRCQVANQVELEHAPLQQLRLLRRKILTKSQNGSSSLCNSDRLLAQRNLKVVEAHPTLILRLRHQSQLMTEFFVNSVVVSSRRKLLRGIYHTVKANIKHS